MSEIIPFFSSPLYHSNIKDLDYFEIYTQLSVTNFKKSTHSELYVSTEEYILDYLPNLKQNIINHVDTYLFERIELKPFEYFINYCWFNKIPPSGYSEIHMHPNSLYSGIVYIDVSDEGGEINFRHNINLTNNSIKYVPEVKKNNIYNSESWMIRPKEGDIIILPSGVLHEVLKNRSDKDRYSFAFNILPCNFKHIGF